MSELHVVHYIAEVAPPPTWGYGDFVLVCGTFGGIGGSPKLVGRGLGEPRAFATMDEAVGLGITLFDTAESYAGGASEIMIGRWMVQRDSAITDRIRIATKVAPPRIDGPGGRFRRCLSRRQVLRKPLNDLELRRSSSSSPMRLRQHSDRGDARGPRGDSCQWALRYVGTCNVDAGQLTTASTRPNDSASRLPSRAKRLQPAGTPR